MPVDTCLERLRIVCREKERGGKRVTFTRSHRDK